MGKVNQSTPQMRPAECTRVSHFNQAAREQKKGRARARVLAAATASLQTRQLPPEKPSGMKPGTVNLLRAAATASLEPRQLPPERPGGMRSDARTLSAPRGKGVGRKFTWSNKAVQHRASFRRERSTVLTEDVSSREYYTLAQQATHSVMTSFGPASGLRAASAPTTLLASMKAPAPIPPTALSAPPAAPFVSGVGSPPALPSEGVLKKGLEIGLTVAVAGSPVRPQPSPPRHYPTGHAAAAPSLPAAAPRPPVSHSAPPPVPHLSLSAAARAGTEDTLDDFDFGFGDLKLDDSDSEDGPKDGVSEGMPLGSRRNAWSANLLNQREVQQQVDAMRAAHGKA